MANYAWVITEDELGETTLESEVGVAGPHDVTGEQIEQARAEGRAFRMYDDDGILYYAGRYIGPDDETMFGPLDDFGTPSAGCTEIAYRNGRSWEKL